VRWRNAGGGKIHVEEFTVTWKPEIEELEHRKNLARQMGGPEGIARQKSRVN